MQDVRPALQDLTVCRARRCDCIIGESTSNALSDETGRTDLRPEEVTELSLKGDLRLTRHKSGNRHSTWGVGVCIVCAKGRGHDVRWVQQRPANL